MADIHRCPNCNALVVDRRFPTCTTCHAALPAEWLLTSDQIAKLAQFDRSARAEHDSAMNDLDLPGEGDPSADL